MDPHDLLSAVHEEETFLAFTQALLADRVDEVNKESASPSSPYGPGANGWENGTIEQFLEAAIAWSEATNVGLSQGLSPDNPWKRFATFLYCGKVYE